MSCEGLYHVCTFTVLDSAQSGMHVTSAGKGS